MTWPSYILIYLLNECIDSASFASLGSWFQSIAPLYLKLKEGVIHRGRRPRWITPSEICRILHILRKPNSIIASLFIQNISSFLKEFRHFRSPNVTQLCPQVFAVNGWIICSGLHFWRHFDVNGSIIFGELHFSRHWFNMAKILSKFGEQQLVMVNYANGFNQSETGKYFEWIMICNPSIHFHSFDDKSPPHAPSLISRSTSFFCWHNDERNSKLFYLFYLFQLCTFAFL